MGKYGPPLDIKVTISIFEHRLKPDSDLGAIGRVMRKVYLTVGTIHIGQSRGLVT